MGGSINNLSLKLLTIGGALCALLLSGCGGGGGSTQSTLPNEGKAVNSLGYYGDGVYFGSKPILGTWQVDKEYRTFKSDGTVTIDKFGEWRYPVNFPYGVNADGKKLTIDFSANYDKIEKVTLVTEANCSEVMILEDFINNTQEISDRNISTQYCKRNLAATLEPISNAGKTSNAYGYYGEGVKFGNDLVAGNWGSVLINGGDGGDMRVTFDINGSFSGKETSIYNSYGFFLGLYGISEDGKIMRVQGNHPYFEIIGLFEGCYLMKDQYNQNHKLCKMEDNDTTWLWLN